MNLWLTSLYNVVERCTTPTVSMLHSKISYSHLNARQTSSIEATIQAIITSMLV